MIQVKEVLGKGKGDSTTIALVNRLTKPAITGANMLEGNEEDMSSRSQRIYIDKRRNAVRIAEMEEIKSAIDLRDAGRATLKDWAMKDTERMVTDQLLSVDGMPIRGSLGVGAARHVATQQLRPCAVRGGDVQQRRRAGYGDLCRGAGTDRQHDRQADPASAVADEGNCADVRSRKLRRSASRKPRGADTTCCMPTRGPCAI